MSACVNLYVDLSEQAAAQLLKLDSHSAQQYSVTILQGHKQLQLHVGAHQDQVIT